LRQAYDYWQDQPGNYYPKRGEAPQRRATGSLTGVFARPEFVNGFKGANLQTDKSKTITASPPSALGRTSESYDPRSNHLVPRSHKIQTHFSLSFTDSDRGLRWGLPATDST
jgi:hypothetical protein